jgi:hypothetical protein
MLRAAFICDTSSKINFFRGDPTGPLFYYEIGVVWGQKKGEATRTIECKTAQEVQDAYDVFKKNHTGKRAVTPQM